LTKLDYPATDRDEYSERIVRGGFPVAVARTGQARRRWLLDYAASVVERDLADLVQLRQPAVFRQVLRICAARTSQILNVNQLANDLGAGRVAVGTYIELLERVFLLTRLSAFSTNLSARVVKHPKLHVNDTGMAAALANIDSRRLAKSTEFGPYMESFVLGELLKQREWAKRRIEIFHFRTHNDHEVDFVLEDENGSVVGIEVKSKRSVDAADLRGLRVLADQLGTRFVHGYVLYTGDHATTYAGDKRFSALRISALWT
jgi:predicted AAA+ superfamily ATPase